MSDRLKVLVWVLGIGGGLIGLALLWHWIGGASVSTTTSPAAPSAAGLPVWYLELYGGVPLWFLIACAAALLLTFVINRSIWRKFGAGSIAMCIFFLVLYLWTHGELEGNFRTLLYFVVFAVWLLLRVTFPDEGEKRLSWIFAFVTFGMLGLSHIFMWDELKQNIQKVHWDGSGIEHASAPTIRSASNAPLNGCDGRMFPGKQVATPQLRMFPPNARIIVTVYCGVVRLEGNNGYEDIDPSGVVHSNIWPTWMPSTIRSLSQQAFYTLSR